MSLSVQFLSLLAMIGTGIIAAAFLDMIGIGTRQAGKKSILRRRAAWFEGIGWVVAGCWTFYILFLVRDGTWRIYDPFAQLSGMLLYVSLFHKPIRFLGRIVRALVLKPLWFIVHLIVLIVRKMIRFTVEIIVLPFRPIDKLFRKYFKNRFNKKAK